MAKYWIDQGSYPAYAATPTWGVAQDGDGQAKTLATSAIASFNVTTGAAVGDAFSIMGVVLSGVASGAGTTQYNVSSTPATQAANLAAAINAATGQVLATVSQSRHQLRNMVYARSTGSLVEIMTRAGSTWFNYATNSAVIISVSGTLAGTITQFSGSVSGCWGYEMNSAAIWPSAIAQNQYGALYSGIGFAPLAVQTLTLATDTIIRRANNAVIALGNGVSVAFSANGRFVVDDGTEWAGDTGTLKWLANITGANTWSLNTAVNSAIALTSVDAARFIIESSSNHAIRLFSGTAAGNRGFQLDNPTLLDSGTASIIIGNQGSPAYGGSRLVFSRLRHYCTSARWYSPIDGIGAASYDMADYTFYDCQFFIGSTFLGTPSTPLIGSIAWLTQSGARNSRIRLRDVSVGLVNKPFICTASFGVVASVAPGSSLECQNVTGCLPYTTTGLLGCVNTAVGVNDGCLIRQEAVGSSEQFKEETPISLVYWTPSVGQPTLDAVLFSGTSWSVGVLWLGTTVGSAVYDSRSSGIVIYRFKQAIVLSGISVVTVEILIDSAIAASVTNKHIVAIVDYVDITGATKTISSAYLTSPITVLPSSSAAWTKYAYTGYVARKIEITLPSAILQNTLIDVALLLAAPAPQLGVTEFFFNPDLGVS